MKTMDRNKMNVEMLIIFTCWRDGNNNNAEARIAFVIIQIQHNLTHTHTLSPMDQRETERDGEKGKKGERKKLTEKISGNQIKWNT